MTLVWYSMRQYIVSQSKCLGPLQEYDVDVTQHYAAVQDANGMWSTAASECKARCMPHICHLLTFGCKCQ